ncbi:MAG TPA: hypothetical protein PKJ41_15640, partial [Bryobacteraceae bacterium]|nr:hypothetical protein [Bryobacteraceae bacterium]
MARKLKWSIWIAAAIGVLMLALVAAGWWLSRRIDPFVRQKTHDYLERRFDSRVDLKSMTVSMPVKSPLSMLLNRGRGAKVHVRLDGLALHHREGLDRPPLLRVARVRAEVDLESLWGATTLVGPVELVGLEITIPPKGERPKFRRKGGGETPPAGSAQDKLKPPQVLIDGIRADGARLTIQPRDSSKAPLVFDIQRLHMNSAGLGVPLRYTATLTNAKPPGRVQSTGSFGPWDAIEPSETQLSGDYDFRDADLGVFKGIAGTLSSKGRFKGKLSKFEVDGETRTPNFRLKSSGNPVPLTTQFHALVDGTNGNTLLQPLDATLGSSKFRVQGGIVRNIDEKGKTVDLDVHLVRGSIEDLLRLAMKDKKPFLRGGIALKMKFNLPTGRGEVADRLHIAGKFALDNAHFTTPAVRSKLDELSRRGQGQPKNLEISEVPARLAGDFLLANGKIDFPRVGFSVPGATVA